MQESYGEGLATHIGLKSCGGVREGGTEASTEVRAGQVCSRERTILRGADAVGISGRPQRDRRYRKTLPDPARSETLCTRGNIMRGNREVLGLSAGDGSADRIGKPNGVRR
jgi:hypothetical protein